MQFAGRSCAGLFSASNFDTILGHNGPLILRSRVRSAWSLVDLLLLVDRELSGAHIDQEKQATDDGEDLEEVVLGEVLVRVMGM